GKLRGSSKGTTSVIEEFVTTGQSQVLEELKETVPTGLVRMLKIPSLGPKKIAKIHDALGIKTIEALKEASLNQEISQLAGFGKKSEANILTNIDTVFSRQDRYPIDKILKFIDRSEEHTSELQS